MIDFKSDVSGNYQPKGYIVEYGDYQAKHPSNLSKYKK
jgi:hypothetical protein